MSDLADSGEVVAGLGIDLGARGTSPASAQKALAERGVGVSLRTLYELRAGTRSSARTAYRLACAAQLRRNDASARTRFCQRVAEVGIYARRYERETGRVFRSTGLVRLIAGAVGCSPNALRSSLKGMRADVALCLTEAKDEELAAILNDVAWAFLQVQLQRAPRKLPEPVLLVAEAWDRRTMADFYRLLHLVGGPRTVQPWHPYEISVMQHFYGHRAAAGSPLTPLDRLILESAERPGEATRRIRRTVAELCGVDFDFHASTAYRHLLVYGTPSSPRTSSRPPIPNPQPPTPERSVVISS